ncbi:MAG: endo alpha-1,4 polygalactosaminidase [Bacteroidia bacterium]|nr:endo alpha-1,4 polygalactosaminidase [Bacteroidia bacterium]
MKNINWLILSFFLLILFNSCKKENIPQINTPLGKIKIWMYQIQDLDENNAIETLAETDYEMLVLEPGDDFTEYPYNTSDMISDLRYTPSGKKRLLIAYIDIGEAEDYRTYWQDDWIAPTATSPGYPDFLITIDPDGWSGNYPVAYWDTLWKNIWLGPNGRIVQLCQLGFDGIYLDWVEAYDDDKVRIAAQEDSVTGEEEMLEFIGEMRNVGKSINPDFVVIAQNAPFLIDYDPAKYSSVIDALAVEDTWFHGAGDADWDDPLAGDLREQERYEGEYSTDNRLKQYKKYLDMNIPVFSD